MFCHIKQSESPAMRGRSYIVLKSDWESCRVNLSHFISFKTREIIKIPCLAAILLINLSPEGG
jgi:hypothetical protein